MTTRKFGLSSIMRRNDRTNDEGTETESTDDDGTDSEETGTTGAKGQFRGLPVFRLSYKLFPKKCLKFSFLSVNTVPFLAGIAAVIMSIWMLADGKLMSRLMGQRLFITILLFIGLYATVISFVGILAVVKKRRKLLVIYTVCHVASLCVIFVCAIMSLSFFDRVMRKVQEEMSSTIVNYHSLDWVTEAWDNTHRYLQCCGIKSYRDWSEYNMKIPQSCCSTFIDKCLEMTEEVAYKAGCLRSTLHLLKSHVQSIAVTAIFIAITLITSVFFAVGIRKRFKMNETTKA